ncbi:MAG: hypothetical protein HGA45_13095 [Chloroflexales bacterium]|nr:hypothetical protein [Chloroflexales bacterium]
MKVKRVAVEGNVVATPGTIFLEGADSGTWTAGKVEVKSYDKLTITQKKAIYSASCTFSFKGKSGNTTVTGTEKIMLEPATTLLMKGRSRVLVTGDTKTGKYGNTLTISDSDQEARKLRTT